MLQVAAEGFFLCLFLQGATYLPLTHKQTVTDRVWCNHHAGHGQKCRGRIL